MKHRTRKRMYINLYDAQVDDYLLVRQATGIQSDTDLVRYLFRKRAIELRHQRVLVDTPSKYDAGAGTA